MANKFHKTKGIILKSIKFKENSKILNILTKDYGLVPFIAKGANNKKNKFFGKTEVFSLVEIVFTLKETRQVQTITDINIEHFFYSFIQDYNKLNFAYLIDDILLKTLLEYKKIEKIFYNVIDIFYKLDELNAKYIPNLYFIFLYEYLRSNGFGLNFNNCQKCDSKLNDNAYFDVEDTQIICNNCAKNITNKYKINGSFLIDKLIYYKLDKIMDVNFFNQNVLWIFNLAFQNHFNYNLKEL